MLDGMEVLIRRVIALKVELCSSAMYKVPAAAGFVSFSCPFYLQMSTMPFLLAGHLSFNV
jgi:hypothetical protein